MALSDGGDMLSSDAEAGAQTPLDAGAPPTVDAALAAQDGSASDASDAAVQDAEIDASPASPALRESLVLPEYWLLLDAGDDPFDDRPAVVECLPAAVLAETLGGERALGIETGSCAYLTVQQPTRREVAVGEVLKVRLWHFELSAPEPAEAHAALVVAGLRILDERISIPQPGGLIVKQLRVERRIPAGTPVYFHLHNHGANSWALVEVSSGPG